ncbi:junctional adhesion molecule B-like [Arapaima gigas]
MGAGEMLGFWALTLLILPGVLGDKDKWFGKAEVTLKVVELKFSLSVEAAGSMPGSASKSVGLLILFAMIPVLLLVVALVVILSVRRSKQGPLTAEHSKENGRERACRESGRDPYTTLDIKSRSPDYDILMGATASGRHSHIHTELQTAAEAPIYENIKLRG